MAITTFSRTPWDRFRQALAAHPVVGRVQDEIRGLFDLLPLAWREWLLPPTRRLWLYWQPGRLDLIEQAGALRIEHGTLPLHDEISTRDLAAALAQRRVAGELWLVLPEHSGLCRLLSLPEAARHQLDALLVHEIDRQTPFSADQVLAAHRVLGPAVIAGQIEVELCVLPKTVLDAALAALGPLAERLAGVDFSATATGSRNLLPASRRVRPERRDLHLGLGLLAIGLLSLGIAGMVSLEQRQQALADLEAARELAFDQAREARALRQRIDTASAAIRFLEERHAAQPTVLEVLDDLTRRLPDDVHLQQLSIEQGRITLIGVAGSAGTLIATLQGSPFLRGPALAGIVQQDARSGRDSFTVVAELVPGGSDATAP